MEEAKLCVLCTTRRIEGEQSTGEHVVPNAIGGRKVVKGFICRDCNSVRGSDWDAAIADQFLFLSSTAGVKRQNGRHPDYRGRTVNGEEVRISSDGFITPARPSYTATPVEGGVNIRIGAPGVETARNLAKRAKKDFPNFDLGEAERQMVVQESPFRGTIQGELAFGGPQAGRSIVKSTLALLSEVDGIDIVSTCLPALAYLNDEQAPAPFGMCYYADLVQSRPMNRVFHCVAVQGQPEHQRILGYVEYFGMARWLVMLSSNYDGPAFEHSYAVDPVAGETLRLHVDFQPAQEKLREILQSIGEPVETYMQAINTGMGIVMRLQAERTLDWARDMSIRRAIAEMGLREDQVLTVEQAEEFERVAARYFFPYWLQTRRTLA